METQNWYAVHVRSRHEFKVSEWLGGNTRVHPFLPKVERLSQWKDRKKLVSFPLFPGYLFVRTLRTYDNLLSILKTPGVVRLVGGAGTRDPVPIPEEQILSIQRLVESKKTLDPYPYLKIGQRVILKRGILAGCQGVLVQKIGGKHRFVVSVDILQRSVSVEMDASEI
jgi:transcription antitermination factor NusG